MTNNLHSSVASQIWLNYFNQTLYRRGIIHEAADHQMLLRIQSIANQRGPCRASTLEQIRPLCL